MESLDPSVARTFYYSRHWPSSSLMPLGSPRNGSAELARDSNDEAVTPLTSSARNGSSPQSQEGSQTKVSQTRQDSKSDLAENNISGIDSHSTVTDEGPRPPLPPRPGNRDFLQPGGSLQRPTRQSRPSLQSSATTALSLADIHTQSYQDGSRETFASSVESTPSGKSVSKFGSIRRFQGRNSSEADDSASIRSYAPTLEVGGDVESLLGDILGSSQQSPGWKLIGSRVERPDPFDSASYEDDTSITEFESEFDELDSLDSEGKNEGRVIPLSVYSCSTVIKRNCCHFGDLNKNISSFSLPPANLFTIVTETTT